VFTPADVKAILRHPLGQSLAALEIEQSKMKQGVRLGTIEQMDFLATVLLRDMDDSAKESREALE
jgi:hypothetical protein